MKIGLGILGAALGDYTWYTPATGKNYFVQFAAWVIAWAPGLLALTLGRSPRADRRV